METARSVGLIGPEPPRGRDGTIIEDGDTVEVFDREGKKLGITGIVACNCVRLSSMTHDGISAGDVLIRKVGDGAQLTYAPGRMQVVKKNDRSLLRKCDPRVLADEARSLQARLADCIAVLEEKGYRPVADGKTLTDYRGPTRLQFRKTDITDI